MATIASLEGERIRRETWVDQAVSVLLAAGMLLEEAQERAEELLGTPARHMEARDAARDVLTQLGWSSGLSERHGIEAAPS